MKINPKIVLICATCIILSGLLGSYKSFQIYHNQTVDVQFEKSHTVAEYLAQNIEQKLLQMEAAVSYLDQSTIETLKRFGARYFAYAYLKEGEWTIKWKVLGGAGKKEILQEVNLLSYGKMEKDRRHWARANDGQLIYIAPVELAESHQLKSGFLIFGIAKDFFKNLKASDESYALVDKENRTVFGDISKFIKKPTDFFTQAEGEGVSKVQETDGGMNLVTAQFSPTTQLWIVRSRFQPAKSFLQSRFFTYFVLTGGFGLLLLLFFMLSGRNSLSRSRGESSRGAGVLRPWLTRLTSHRRKPRVEPARVESREIDEGESEKQVVGNFADFLDQLLQDEIPRLTQLGISIKTQVEEGVEVVCSPQKISDFLKRLIGNSVFSLEGEDDKEIQIQLVEQASSYQLIYVDTRTKNFPSKQPASLMAQTEGSLQGIDGIIAYAGWLFGDQLTVAKSGFCLSIDVEKHAEVVAHEEFVPEVLPMEETLERIEIDDSDTDLDMIEGFTAIGPGESESSYEFAADGVKEEEPDVSFDEVIEQFRAKEFRFTESEGAEEASNDAIEPTESLTSEKATDEVDLKTNDQGMVEFNNGQFKIKIRSPKKRDTDVDR